MATDWNETVSEKALERLSVLFSELFASVAAVIQGGGDEEGYIARYEMMRSHTDELLAAVKGNRPEGLPVNRGDVRLLMTKWLRYAIDELDRG
jgi:hypothetical protein